MRELQLGDLVQVADKSPIKGKYRLAIVTGVNVSTDGVVRSADLTYHLPGPGLKVKGRTQNISRSVQRLSLILGVEEQDCQLDVIEKDTHSIVVAGEPKAAQVNA